MYLFVPPSILVWGTKHNSTLYNYTRVQMKLYICLIYLRLYLYVYPHMYTLLCIYINDRKSVFPRA